MRAHGQDSKDRQADDPDPTPETPFDEPSPTPVKDPPPQPDPKGPYVVQDADNTMEAER
jgi:hypothetical protein